MSHPQTRPLKKLVVRKAGPVRLTAAASAIYGDTCGPSLPGPIWPWVN
ncbi:hypothetical protein [Plantactinospora sonchi]|uniref:Uncharacterized protein n=1 Tax=Plantactinospora sonchi TaxID=1544735 RepID=A0ABU7RYT6_9ACTN